MILTLTDRRENRRLALTPRSSYCMPWEPGEAGLITFEAYDAGLKGADANDLAMPGFLLETAGGWVVGCRTHPRLPAARFLSLAELLRRAFPDFAPHWRHSGRPLHHPLIDVIPPELPGAGMVLVRNLSALTSVPLKGPLVDQEAARREHVLKVLPALGFEPAEETHGSSGRNGARH